MMKKVFIGILLAIPCIYADWIDDLANLIKDDQLNQLQAEQTLKTYISKDEEHITRLEKKLEVNDEDGVWATLRGGTLQMQWAAAKASLRYHKKVADFIKGLPKNEKDKQNLIHHLTLLNQHRKELEQLQENYQESSGLGNSLKAGSLVAAKELHIRGRKAFIKSSFIV